MNHLNSQKLRFIFRKEALKVRFDKEDSTEYNSYLDREHSFDNLVRNEAASNVNLIEHNVYLTLPLSSKDR